MGDLVFNERALQAAAMLQKKYPDEKILLGGTSREPTDKMVAAGAAVIQGIQDYLSPKTARLIWEAMWAASEDERTY